MTGDLLLRNVEVEGRAGLDVRVEAGRVTEIAPGLRTNGPDLDGAGGALIPGLIDHHLHLFALAAEAVSLRLAPGADLRAGGFESVVRARAADLAPGEGLRLVGYDEAMVGDLDRRRLDGIVRDRPLRVQHRSGALWILNTAALDELLRPEAPPPCVERGEDGELTGRVWRGDEWLRRKAKPPSLAAVSARLASLGVTGVTDASVTTDQKQARVFEDAVRSGELRQRLTLMSGGPLAAPADGAFHVGPVKILLDDADLPDFETAQGTVTRARAWGRAVAIHCVSAGELAFSLALLEAASAGPGDRIEHGGVISPQAAARIAELGLTVVTQPGLPAERGDRYLADVDPRDAPFLYPCASLMRAGVRVAGGTDAPYAQPDPWSAMRAAVSRTTASGRPIGQDERIGARRALGLFLGAFDDPGGAERRVRVGAAADLCLLRTPLAQALPDLGSDLVRATIVGGQILVWRLA